MLVPSRSGKRPFLEIARFVGLSWIFASRKMTINLSIFSLPIFAFLRAFEQMSSLHHDDPWRFFRDFGRALKRRPYVRNAEDIVCQCIYKGELEDWVATGSSCTKIVVLRLQVRDSCATQAGLVEQWKCQFGNSQPTLEIRTLWKGEMLISSDI